MKPCEGYCGSSLFQASCGFVGECETHIDVYAIAVPGAWGAQTTSHPPRARHSEGVFALSVLGGLGPILFMHHTAEVASHQGSTAARMNAHIPCSPPMRAAAAATLPPSGASGK